MVTASLPPGPPRRGGNPITRIRYGLNFLTDPFGFVGGRFEEYGDAYFVAAENQPGLFVFRKPEDVWQVLVGEARSFTKAHSAFRDLEAVLGDSGLLTTDGDTWRRHRRIVQPAFAPAMLDAYASVMIEEASAEADRWRDGEVFDVSQSMMELTLRLVTRTLFGHESGGYAETVRAAMRTLQEGLVANLPVPAWLDPTRTRRERAVGTLDGLIADIIATRRKSSVERDDLLGRLLRARDPEGGAALTDSEIRDHLVTFFLAGHETTSNALTWTFHLLGRNPKQRERLEAHLDEVLGGRLPTPADLPRLEFTTQVFEESMRLYPPVYVIARKASEDVRIGEWDVPAGSEVVLWVWHTHRDERTYPRPAVFDPDRFSSEAKSTRARGAYLPFGLGPRMCVGKVFATMEGTLLLATLAQRFRLYPEGRAPKLYPRVTLSPKGGLTMRARAR